MPSKTLHKLTEGPLSATISVFRKACGGERTCGRLGLHFRPERARWQCRPPPERRTAGCDPIEGPRLSSVSYGEATGAGRN